MELKDIDKLIKEKKKELQGLDTGIATRKTTKKTLQGDINTLTDKKINIEAYLEKKEKELMASVEDLKQKAKNALVRANDKEQEATRLNNEAKNAHKTAKDSEAKAASGNAEVGGKIADAEDKVKKVVEFVSAVKSLLDKIK